MRRRILAATLSVVALTGGCGSGGEAGEQPAAKQSASEAKPLDGLSPRAILDRSVAAARLAGRAHIKGTSPSEGVTLDIRTSVVGAAQGTVSTAGEGSVELRLLGNQLYFQGDRAFWTSNADAEVARRLAGKWLKDDRTEPRFEYFANLLSLDKLMERLAAPAEPRSIVDGRGVGGRATVGLLDSGPKGEQSTVFVAADARPLPLLLMTDADDHIELSEWGEPFDVAAPVKELVIDAREVMGD